MRYEELELGTKVRCVNGEGWERFEEGGVYEVTEFWGVGIDLNDCPVASKFFDDFEVVE